MDQGEHETIGTTGNHPFWSVDRQEFVQARSLRKGEYLRTINGESKRVVSKLARPGPESVYNLEVFGEHTYFVGKDGVLVHNMAEYNGNAPKYGVHWTTAKRLESIEGDNLLKASDDLVWVETANSTRQLKEILKQGGVATGAKGNDVAIILDLSDIGTPRIVGGGGAAFRLPEGIKISGADGRGLTWWWNTGSQSEINKIVGGIRDGHRTY